MSRFDFQDRSPEPSRRRSPGPWIRAVWAAALVLLLPIVPPVSGAVPAGEAGRAANIVAGRIFREGGDVPAGGATVRMYHLTSGRLFSTATTMDSGAFILTELPDGSYDFSVETLGGSFHGADILTLAGGMRVRTSFILSNEALPDAVKERLARMGVDPVPTHGVIRVRREGPADPGARHAGRATAWVLGSLGTGYVLYELEEDEEVSRAGP